MLESVTRECTLSNHCPSEQRYRGLSPAPSHRSQDEASDSLGTSEASELPFAVRVAVKLLSYGSFGVYILAAVHIC